MSRRSSRRPGSTGALYGFSGWLSWVWSVGAMAVSERCDEGAGRLPVAACRLQLTGKSHEDAQDGGDDQSWRRPNCLRRWLRIRRSRTNAVDKTNVVQIKQLP